MTNSTPTVVGSVNKQPISLLIDTGANQTLLTKQTVERLGLALSHSDKIGFGVGGESQKYSAVVNEFSVGNVTGGKARLAIMADSQSIRTDAILGVDFLLQRDLEIDFGDKKLNYFYPSDCDKVSLAYWDRDAHVVAIRDLSPADKRQIFDVEIQGQSFRALLDTGAQISVIDKAAAARLGMNEQSAGVIKKSSIVGGGKRVVDSWLFSLESLSIGSEKIRDLKITMSSLYGSLLADSQTQATVDLIRYQPEIILGMDFIESHRILFAMSQKKMYFSYVGGPVFQSRKVEKFVSSE